MQIDDEMPDDEELDTQVGDVFANPEEIKKAIEALYRDVSAKKRLVAIAYLLLENKAHLRRQYQAEDLFQEALERIAMGKRRWPTNRLDFLGLVIGVMKSWSYSLEKAMSRENDHIVMEHELIVSDGEDDTLNLEGVVSGGLAPLEHLEASETDLEEKSHLVILKAQYGATELPARILEVLSSGVFDTHAEVISTLKVKETDYRNAWKRLMHAAEKLKESKNGH